MARSNDPQSHNPQSHKVNRPAILRRALTGCFLLAAALAFPERADAFACQWSGASSGNWATAGNWTSCNSTTPQSGDTANVPAVANQPAIQSGTSVTVGQVTVASGMTLTVSSGGSLSLNNGLTGGGNLTVAGALNLPTGTMDGAGTTTIQSGATVTMASSYVTLQRAFVNAGTVTVSSSAYFNLNTGGSITNQSTGTIDLQGNTYAFYSNVAGLPITNTGSITRTAGAGTATVYNVTLTNTSPGSISVSSGTLDLATAGPATHTGSFSAPGATLQISGSGTNTISGSISGGTVIFTASQSTTLTGPYSATNTNIVSGTVSFNQASPVSFTNLTLSGGTLSGSANVNVSGTFHATTGTMSGSGTITVLAGGIGTLDSSYLGVNRPFVNAGTMTLSASGYINLNTGGSFVNQTGGTLDIQMNTYAFYGNVVGLSLTNTGAITRTAGSGTATIYNIAFTNTSPGSVTLSSGTVDFATIGVSTHTGSFSAPGGVLQFSGSASNTISGNVTGTDIRFGGSQNSTLSGTYSTTNMTVSGGTVTFNEPSITVTNATLSAGTATFNQTSTLALVNLTLSGGTLAGSANVQVSGLLHGTSGGMAGSGTTTLLASGTGTFDSSYVGIGRPFINAAPITMSASGYFNMTTGGSITNQAGGSIDLQQNTYAFYANTAGLPVVNTGSLTRTAGAGTATIYNVAFTNTSPGTVTASSGTIDLATTGSSTHTGSFSSPGGTLTFSGSATNAISGAISGLNIIFTSSQASTLTGPYTPTNTTLAGGTTTFNEASPVTIANLTITGGTLTGSANVNVSGNLHVTSATMAGTGTTTILAGGTGVFDSSYLSLSRPFVNAGAITLSASSYFNLSTGGSVANQTGGTMDLQQNTYAFYGNTAGLPVTNTGSLTRTGAAGTSTAYNISFTNTAPGTVAVSSGTLDLATVGTTTHTGSFSAPGATLQFSGSATNTINGSVTGGTIQFGGSQSSTLSGTYSVSNTNVSGGSVTFTEPSIATPNVTLSGGTATFNQTSTLALTNLTLSGGTLAGSANVQISGLFHVTSGGMAGTGTSTLLAAATGTFDSSYLSLRRPFLNAGAITMSASSYWNMDTGGSFVNQGGATLNLQQNTYAFYGNVAGLPTSNSGTITRTGGVGTSTIYNVPFVNTGTVSVQAGVLTVYDYTQTAGTTSLAGGNITASGNPLRIQGGTLAGTGTITGNVNATANGIVAPGNSPGAITITGNYTQSSPAAFNTELAGTGAGQFDRISASGAATIGGNLNVSLLSFTPVQGNSFALLDYGSHVGTFGTLNLPVLPGGLSWVPRYAATGFSLRVQALLPGLPFRVDVHPASTGVHNGNGVLDPGERVLVEPTWTNPSAGILAFTGVFSNFNGPSGAVYTISKPNADYGTLSPTQTSNCFSATGNCYELSVDNPTTRPAAHWDTTIDETASNGDLASWTLHVGGSFTDVAPTSPQYRFVETLFHNLITGGCGTGVYCPASTVTRGQMAVFLLKSKFGASYLPPPATGTIFADVPAASGTAPFIENLAALAVTGGCGGGNYCPNANATRGQMAVFLLKTDGGPSYTPPPCVTPTFNDVPCASGFAAWIEELVRRGITAGCGGGAYCPASPVTRGQMAVFLTTTFSLVLNGP